jgi:VWFA-related protein
MKLLKLSFCLAVFALVAGAQDHRSLAMFFDLNSMSAQDVLRVQESAIKFVEEQMKPSDLITIMTFTTDLKVVQDFSGDRDILIAALRGIVPAPDAAPAGDRNPQLRALQSAATTLTPIPGKKALIYFSTGAPRTGVDDQDQLKATINAAVQANVAIYSVDSAARIR